MRVVCGLMVGLSITVSASILREKTITTIDRIKIFPTALCHVIVSYLDGAGKLIPRKPYKIVQGRSILTLKSIGAYVACGDDRGSVHLFDVDSSKVTHQFDGHNGDVVSLVELSGGRFASGSTDETVRIWDITTKQCTNILRGHRKGAASLAAHGDNLLVAFARVGLARLWNIDTGECVKEFGIGNALCPLPSGDLLSGDIRGNIELRTIHDLLNPQDDQPVEIEIKSKQSIIAISCSPQGKLAVSYGAPVTTGVEIWDSVTKKYMRSIEMNCSTFWMKEAVWLSDERLVLLFAIPNQLSLYEVETRQQLQSVNLNGRKSQYTSAIPTALAQINNCVAVGNGDGELIVLDRDIDIVGSEGEK